MRPATWIVLALALAACQSPAPAGEKFTSAEDGYSCELPDGWEARHDRGATIFSSPAHAHRTFVIRAVPLPASAEEATFLRATDLVMDGLPGVELTGRRAFDGALHGVRYDLTFLPPGASERYRRAHVVLFGEARAYHVIETTAASVASDDLLLTRLLGTFAEEV